MGKKIKAYIIDIREKGINQTTKFVEFVGGIGVLDAKALCAGRPEWFKHKTLTQERGIMPEQYAKYWADKGAKVTAVSQEEADRIRALLIKGRPVPDKYYEEPPVEEVEDPEEDPENESPEDHLGDGKSGGEKAAAKTGEESAEEHLPPEGEDTGDEKGEEDPEKEKAKDDKEK